MDRSSIRGRGVQSDVCLHGGRHRWTVIATWVVGPNTPLLGRHTSWCSRCGSITEHVYHNGRKVRCEGSDGRPYIDIPEVSRVPEGQLIEGECNHDQARITEST